MSKNSKTFTVECVHCGETFHIRHELTQPDAEGEAEVVVQCLYCSEKSIVPIPRRYVEKDEVLRSIERTPPEE